MIRLGFLGAGKMAQSLAKGFIASGLSKSENIIASCPPADQVFLDEFKAFGCQTTHHNDDVLRNSEVVLVATKPHIVSKVLNEIKPVVRSDHLVLSIAMGLTIGKLEEMLPPKTRLIRVMPNTPSLVRTGATVYVRGSSAKVEDGSLAEQLFSSVGTCDEVPESLMDVITAVASSGPAYMYIVMEALADGGVKMGLPRQLAYKLAAQTMLGSAKMVLDTNKHPGMLKDDVGSPGGCTMEAVYQLECSGLRASIMQAVVAATTKCQQTGKMN